MNFLLFPLRSWGEDDIRKVVTEVGPRVELVELRKLDTKRIKRLQRDGLSYLGLPISRFIIIKLCKTRAFST
ncbi:hypothetical protein MKW98_028475 [Papaver atlanticum]|uniref:Uncharacterized protein n=1 Tax=Papaver atlanticum TaxID=357466 RepID=A0AAD4TGM7_9MAGN|nr:hypothetical protein MKW98_028475 [Papaver atlanticum]